MTARLRAGSLRQRKAERKEEQERLLERLRRDAAALCREFGLRLRVLEAERPQVRRRYGVCFRDGTIRIRLRHARTGRLLKYSALIDTLCHELAHLRHFDHSPRFRAFHQRILARARSLGIYRPTPRGGSYSAAQAAAEQPPSSLAVPVAASPTRAAQSAASLRRPAAEPRPSGEPAPSGEPSGREPRSGTDADAVRISRRRAVQLSLFDGPRFPHGRG
jgi:hypothetical protein